MGRWGIIPDKPRLAGPQHTSRTPVPALHLGLGHLRRQEPVGAGPLFAQHLSPIPSKLWEAGVLSVSLTARGLFGLGACRGKGIRLSHSSQPPFRDCMRRVKVPQHHRGGLGSSRVKGRSMELWPKVLRAPLPHKYTSSSSQCTHTYVHPCAHARVFPHTDLQTHTLPPG